MTQTLRRKLGQTIFDILTVNHASIGLDLNKNKETVDVSYKIADAVLAIINEKPEKPTPDPMWNLLHGIGVAQEDLDKEQFVKKALDAFETDMRTPKNWNWYPAKSSEEKAWKLLREFVVEQYQKDPKCFQTYETWRTQPYARGAMSNLRIKNNPEDFPASWSDFLASHAMYGQPEQKQEQQPQMFATDDNDLPISY